MRADDIKLYSSAGDAGLKSIMWHPFEFALSDAEKEEEEQQEQGEEDGGVGGGEEDKEEKQKQEEMTPDVLLLVSHDFCCLTILV